MLQTQVPLPLTGEREAGCVWVPGDVGGERGAGDAATLPLVAGEQVFGMLVLHLRERRTFSEAEKGFLEQLVELVIPEMQKARLHEQLVALNRSLAATNAERTRQLGNERDRMDAILLSVTDGLIVTDLHRRIVLANPAAQCIFSISSDAEGPTTLDVAIGEEAANEVVPPTAAALHELPEVELEVMSEGRKVFLSARTATVYARNGDVLGYVTVFRDMTRSKELDAMKTEFVSTAAHELRTPLTTLCGFSEILLTRTVSETEQRRFLQYINKESVALASIVSDMLTISRLEMSGADVLRFTRCNLQQICAAEAEVAQRSTTAHHIDVTGLLPVPEVVGDEGRIGQIVRNVLSNAIKYSPKGGEIAVACEASSRWAIITVKDHGIGMTPEQVAHVFEKFYRADALTTAAPGTGLGMSIVQQVVRHHGGAVWVESEPGVGTTVRVALPIAGVEPLALIVGQSYQSTEALAAAFSKDAWQAVVCETVEAGLATALQELPNVVVLALPMPEQQVMLRELSAEHRTGNLALLSLAEPADVVGIQRLWRGRRLEVVRRSATVEDIVRRASLLEGRRHSTVEVSV